MRTWDFSTTYHTASECFSLTALRHNDLAWQIRAQFENQLDKVDLTKNGSGADPAIYGHAWHTDIPRLRAGKVGGQVSKAGEGVHTQGGLASFPGFPLSAE